MMAYTRFAANAHSAPSGVEKISCPNMFSAHLTAIFLHVNQLIKYGNTSGLHALTP
jgi:hypothetical protein